MQFIIIRKVVKLKSNILKSSEYVARRVDFGVLIKTFMIRQDFITKSGINLPSSPLQ